MVNQKIQKNKLKILLLGKNGQLASTFIRYFDILEINYQSLSSKTLNLLELGKINKVLEKYSFDILINCTGYTKVDQAEIEKEKALKINAESLNYISKFCKKRNKLLIHYSTDYIFNSLKKIKIKEQISPKPINYYGLTKSKGEEYIIKSNCDYIIFRVGWLYSIYGINFVKNIYEKLMNNQKLSIVNDQIGIPTSAEVVVKLSIKSIEHFWKKKVQQTFHISNSGQCTWFEFTSEIQKLVLKSKKLKAVKIRPISTNNLKLKAKRPSYSSLDSKKIFNLLRQKQIHWKKDLNNNLTEIFKIYS